jgi:hypothetical protein
MNAVTKAPRLMRPAAALLAFAASTAAWAHQGPSRCDGS